MRHLVGLENELVMGLVSRHAGLLTESEIEKISASTIAIAGLGSVGSCTAELVVRIGVGKIKLADLDNVDLSNLNRQILYDFLDLGQPKMYAALRKLRKVNPFLKIDLFQEISRNNIAMFMKDAKIVVDAVDDHLLKVLISRTARKMNTPVLHLNAFGFRMTATTFVPDGISYEELFDMPSKNKSLDLLTKETFKPHIQKITRALSRGMMPDRVTSQLVNGQLAHPVFTSASVLAGAMGASEVAKLLAGRESEMIIAPKVFQFDLLSSKGGVFEFDHTKRPTFFY